MHCFVQYNITTPEPSARTEDEKKKMFQEYFDATGARYDNGKSNLKRRNFGGKESCQL